jgi:hypothetical protein
LLQAPPDLFIAAYYPWNDDKCQFQFWKNSAGKALSCLSGFWLALSLCPLALGAPALSLQPRVDFNELHPSYSPYQPVFSSQKVFSSLFCFGIVRQSK